MTGRLRQALRPRRVVLGLVVVVAVVIAAKVLLDNSDELLGAADTLTHLEWGWVAVALVLEVMSYATRGVGQSILLRQAPGVVPDGRGRPGYVVLGAGTLAGDAAAYCLPFGFAASGVVMFRVLRRRSVDPTVAGWMFAVSTLLYLGAMCVLTIGAVEIAGGEDPVPGLQEAALILIVVLGVLGLGFVALRRGPLVGLARRLRIRRRAASVRSARRDAALEAGALPTPGPVGRVLLNLRRRTREHVGVLRTIRVPPALLTAAFAMMLLSWLSDIAVLGIAYESVGSSPPWLGLLLAYCAGQVAAAMPVTPGGLGVVEGSLTLALVAFGSSENTSLAAVLLYRLIAYWMCIPLGALAWLGLRAAVRRRTGTPPVSTAVASDPDSPAVAA
ncbi:lysylphosphatidylglycerol synthase transmembrane domain-containing protein [Actinomycetospora chiangmaiensis]|uniref:lysylphosphatidylglycerol synthase transmembrane domain-containing protein n=1 Tax=Actinomycetospora chiangmaiensis TaxID=402650 RepID=UPI00037222CC|nr:lysylphosphatidylglycerol synthase transmembrane domain-containing protein [Actinomycetospora chiangmaiensis]